MERCRNAPPTLTLEFHCGSRGSHRSERTALIPSCSWNVTSRACVFKYASARSLTCCSRHRRTFINITPRAVRGSLVPEWRNVSKHESVGIEPQRGMHILGKDVRNQQLVVDAYW